LKKLILRRKNKHKSITSEKSSGRKALPGVFYLKICKQRMSIIYGKRENTSPLP
jgi:hypothetical protein